MESSRESVPKKLNGHGNGLKGSTSESSEVGTSQEELSSLVEELARAMNMARENLDRPQSKATAANVNTNPLPAMPPPRGIFDDEDDDAAMPIPSTWRTPPEPPKTGAFRDQARAAAMGFMTGLAVVVPVVLYLTGRLDNLPLDALFGSDPGTESAVHSAAASSPAAMPLEVQQRAVPTTIIRPTEAAVIPAAAVAPEPSANEETPAEPPKPSWSDTIAEGKARISAGAILEGREILLPAAEANEPEALMALAETYDPNMLAAWGVLDVTADVAKARELYQRAAQAGIETARIRLNGLN